MNIFITISLSFALFGSWQLCQVFAQSALKPAQDQALPWIAASQAFALVAILLFDILSIGMGSIFLGFSVLMMLQYGHKIFNQTDLATSLMAVSVFSTFLLLVSLFFRALIR